MKRFIDLGEQTGNTDTGVHEFSFFDTVRGKFECFQGECCFTSEEEFKEYYKGDELERYLGLIPDDFNKPKRTLFKDLVTIGKDGDDTEYYYNRTIYYASEIVGVIIKELGISEEDITL